VAVLEKAPLLQENSQSQGARILNEGPRRVLTKPQSVEGVRVHDDCVDLRARGQQTTVVMSSLVSSVDASSEPATLESVRRLALEGDWAGR
jgi:hypothetical protein